MGRAVIITVRSDFLKFQVRVSGKCDIEHVWVHGKTSSGTQARDRFRYVTASVGRICVAALTHLKTFIVFSRLSQSISLNPGPAGC